jgi:hypothetical protein
MVTVGVGLLEGSTEYNKASEGPTITAKNPTGNIVQANSSVFSFQLRTIQVDSNQGKLILFKSI